MVCNVCKVARLLVNRLNRLGVREKFIFLVYIISTRFLFNCRV